jgi:hypothetical protein
MEDDLILVLKKQTPTVKAITVRLKCHSTTFDLKIEEENTKTTSFFNMTLFEEGSLVSD